MSKKWNRERDHRPNWVADVIVWNGGWECEAVGRSGAGMAEWHVSLIVSQVSQLERLVYNFIPY